MMTDFAVTRNLLSSKMFPHNNVHKGTWISPNGRTRNQIDHVMTDARHARNIINVWSYTGAERNSVTLKKVFHIVDATVSTIRILTTSIKQVLPARYKLRQCNDEKSHMVHLCSEMSQTIVTDAFVTHNYKLGYSKW